ncbi:MAG: hypothetical protein K0R41_2686, partial [Geminicoccaceae bacterium]|nr:hypothetical protein [Geminicoccaceae bacterium]
ALQGEPCGFAELRARALALGRRLAADSAGGGALSGD